MEEKKESGTEKGSSEKYRPMLEVGEVNVPMMVFRIFLLIAVVLIGLFVLPYVVARKYK